MNGTLTDLDTALDGLVGICEEWIGFEPPSFTCREAEVIADLLRLVAGHETANEFLWAHSTGDDEDDDMHHGMPRPDSLNPSEDT